MNFNTCTELAIYLAGTWRSEEYLQIQNQLNYELNKGVLKDVQI